MRSRTARSVRADSRKESAKFALIVSQESKTSAVMWPHAPPSSPPQATTALPIGVSIAPKFRNLGGWSIWNVNRTTGTIAARNTATKKTAPPTRNRRGNRRTNSAGIGVYVSTPEP
jgi:hypothetical protein